MDTRVLVLVTVILHVCCGYHSGDRICGNHNKPMEKCDPDQCTTEKKPCIDCRFCKKDKDGVYKCHPAQKINSEDDMKKFIANFEGCRLKVYQDSKNLPTVGYGFNLSPADAKTKFKKALPGVDFDNVKSGAQKLTEEQAWKLFCSSVDEKIEIAKKLIGDALYNKLPWKVKAAIVNAVFRGELKSTHKTVKLIKEEKWEEVSKEYLDNDEYRKSKAKGPKHGVWKRMDCNAWQFDCMVPGRHKCHKKE